MLFAVAQGEISNKEKMACLKQLHMAVKQRNIPSLLVITKIETADKLLLNSSGTITETPASHRFCRRGLSQGCGQPLPFGQGPWRQIQTALSTRERCEPLTMSASLACTQVLKLIEKAEKNTGFAKVRAANGLSVY